MGRRLVALVVLLAALGPAAGAAPGALDGPAAAEVQTVRLTQSFAAIPHRPGVVLVTHRFEIPEAVETLRTAVPPRATVVSVEGGFGPAGEDRYEWTGGSATPRLTYRLPVNATGSVAGPEARPGRYRFVDVGEWGLFRRPTAPIDVTYRGATVDFARETAVDGPGAAGDWLVFVGEATIHTRRAHGQTFRLVEPAAAELAEPPEELLTAVGDASEALRIGDRDESVLMVAAPTGVDWAVEGLEVGDSDFYVTADERLSRPINTWLHEYVHTRQAFNLSRDTRWLTEATATYYAALLTLEQDRIDFATFRDALAVGSQRRFADAVLAEPETWRTGTNYRKGALVAGDLDRRLRLATDSREDFQAVVRRLNARRTGLDAGGFSALLGRLGGTGVGDAASRYTTTTATPDAWDAAAHAEAFGTLPPRIRYLLPADTSGTSYHVAGPYRNRTLEGPPFVLVPGERLGVDVAVTNGGGTAGSYNLTYGFDDGPRRSHSGEIAVGERRVVRVWGSVATTGTRVFQVGEATLDVSVREPAAPTVTAVSASRSTVAPDETVDVAVTLANDAARPGRRDLALSVDGRVVTNRTVRLDAGTTRTVTIPVRLAGAGEYRLGVGDRSTTVTVAAETTDARGPAVGPVGALLAIGIAGLLARRAQ